jgi:WD40 repeat protein
MDVAQAQQEIQRLRGLYESGQIAPEAFLQAINQLQIVDASGSFWHVDGLSPRWYRYNGQNWVEQAPPLPPAPPVPPGPVWTPPDQAVPAAGIPPARSSSANSRLPLWIGLGAVLVLVAAAAGAYLGGAFRPGKDPIRVISPTPAATLSAVQATGTPASARTATTPTATKPGPSASPTAVKTAPERNLTPTNPATPGVTVPSAALYLPANGPWLLSKDENNLYLVGANQTTPINSEKVVAPGDLEAMIAPKGGYVAFVTSADPSAISGLNLNIYNLTSKKMEKVIALTSAKTEPKPNAGPGDPALEAVRSITEFNSLAWSPDGRRLAFIGVQDGPSSDLYMYALDTQKVTRLTDGPSQGFSPSWSPDGKYIVQFGATSFGTGAGISMAGVWATQADTGISTSLYPTTSSGEIELGWANANTTLVYSFNAMCGYYNLRAVSLQPLKVTTVFGGCFNATAFDPASGSIVLGITQGQADLCNCGKKVDSGLYLVKLDGSLKRLNSADVRSVAYLKNAGAAWGYADNQGGIAYSLAGKALTLPAGLPSGTPFVSAGGKAWAWTAGSIDKKPGVWVGAPDGNVTKVSDLPSGAATWTQDGSALLFLSNTSLYAAPAPGYQTVLLGKTSAANQMGWAGK